MRRRGLVSKDDHLSLLTQCDLLGISKSCLYYLPKGESDENLDIMMKMDKYHYEHDVLEIINSDQGSQFTSPACVNKLNEHGISISMDGRGRATDNIYIEKKKTHQGGGRQTAGKCVPVSA